MKQIICMLAVAASAAWCADTDVGLEIFPNGDFSRLDGSGWCAGWAKGRGDAKIVGGADGARLVLSGPQAQVDFALPLKPEWGQLKLSTQMKVTGVTLGDEGWKNGRLAMCFLNAAGQRVGAWPDVFGFEGTTGWQPCERIYPVPQGAVKLSVNPANFGTSGTVEFKALSLKVSRIRAEPRANAPLPDGAPQDVWGLDGAWRQATPTREKIAMNGLWGFRPVLTNETPGLPPAPDDCWGWCKVPAVWPTARWEAVQAAQTIWLSPWLEENDENAIIFDQAWYRRTITVPRSFEGRRVVLDFTMLQTHAKAFVDGAYAGELWYPGGELDLTKALVPGKEQEIALLVTARPFSAESHAFMAPDRVIKSKAHVKLRGITGDLYLTATPSAARIEDAQVVTSTRDSTVTFIVETTNLASRAHQLRAEVKGCGETKTFSANGLPPAPDGTLRFTAEWKNPKLWDTHTPGNRYTATLSLLDASGNAVDTFTPVTFGFREFRTEGRDFMLNDTPIHLRALHNTTMNTTADKACKAAALEHCRRIKQYGFNFIIAGNYDFEAGSTSYLDGLLEACDETGTLLAFSLPHIKDFGYALDNPNAADRYRAQARWLIRRARNHPSVILYAMNHNACGYYGDQNPLKIDGLFQMPDNSGAKNAWWENNRRHALTAAAIASALDPTRPVYHHQSGNLGVMHTVNIYLNWAPRQERSDWLEHWSAAGVKPLFFVEWGMPHISSWSSYRGPEFIWRCAAFQSLWASEYAAQFWGDAAYQPTPEAHAALAHEEKLWARGEPFTWSELNRPLTKMTNNYQNVQAYFANDNWRAHRAHGISAMLPWDQGDAWHRIRETPIRPAPDSLKDLKQPGIVPDHLRPDYCFINDTGDPSAFAPSAVGNTFLRWNMPDCAFIAGGTAAFTDKTHLYPPAANVTKALVILNDRRTPQTVNWQCALTLGNRELKKTSGAATIPPGGQARVPVTFTLPKDPGDFALNATFDFEGNVRQTDTFALRAVAPPPPLDTPLILLYDTKGHTAKLFDRLGIRCKAIQGDSPLPHGMPIAIGRESLDETSVRWIRNVTAANAVLVMEQTSRQLTGLLGFRIAERGARLLFPRFPHPVTEGLDAEDLRDWTGFATLLPEHLTDIDPIEFRDPGWTWCGQWSTRVWRCGNRNSAASVLIEKPSRGNWRALIDGEFDLQYSPLLEYIEGNTEGNIRRVIFCQLDVSGRTAPDPVADLLTVRLLNALPRTIPQNAPPQNGAVVCCGGSDARAFCLHEIGVTEASAESPSLFIASSGANIPQGFHQKIRDGANALCLGMNADEIALWSPVPIEGVTFTNTYFTRIENLPPELNGLSNADWAWHGAMSFWAFPMTPESNQAIRIVRHGKGTVVFWQVPPWEIDAEKKPYLRTTKRRAHAMLARLLGNLGHSTRGFPHTLYFDTPENVDDPYRYYRW